MKAKQIFQYSWPAIPLGVATVVALASGSTLPSNLNSNPTDHSVSVQSGEAHNADDSDAEVKVNGQEVDVNENVPTTIRTNGGTTTVTVSGNAITTDSKRTETLNSDGTMSVHVGTSSNSNDSRTTVRYSGSGSQKLRGDSSIKVKVEGTGSASVNE